MWPKENYDKIKIELINHTSNLFHFVFSLFLTWFLIKILKSELIFQKLSENLNFDQFPVMFLYNYVISLISA